jgi:hypothetical protein
MIAKYLLYLVRWQLSTPILAAFVYWLTDSCGATLTTVLANLVGGLIFFWIDRWIFSRTAILAPGKEIWEIQNGAVCCDCGKSVARAYRLIRKAGYNRMSDPKPEYRCHECSRCKHDPNHAITTRTPAKAR